MAVAAIVRLTQAEAVVTVGVADQPFPLSNKVVQTHSALAAITRVARTMNPSVIDKCLSRIITEPCPSKYLHNDIGAGFGGLL